MPPLKARACVGWRGHCAPIADRHAEPAPRGRSHPHQRGRCTLASALLTRYLVLSGAGSMDFLLGAVGGILLTIGTAILLTARRGEPDSLG